MRKAFDVAVVGAGVFGAWTAHYLRKSGATVALIEAYGSGNSRSSSGGETRVIRMGYGADELYTRWAIRSLPIWQELESRTGVQVFHPSGVLWLSDDQDQYTRGMWDVLASNAVECERVDADALRRRYPQLVFPEVTWALYEAKSGLLMARKSVQLLVTELEKAGVECIQAAVSAPNGKGKLHEIEMVSGESLSAENFIFACGAWLPKLFPELLRARIFPTRQEVFFIGPPPGSSDFQPQKMPVWLHHAHPDIPYALPDIEGRGFKIAFDRHGQAIDPDDDERVVRAESVNHLRTFLAKHIPRLKAAPILETRVCQYENTWNGDFLMDRHPELENVFLVGGGSGHGFKHGPAVGDYVSTRILHNAPAEPRFSLASKQSSQSRAVY
jgi:monomeric sarcosine oxidase